ncbi:MAG: GNAT family N-acetyltransferase [Brucellaceae bacterium]|nr:GNAT family N-acetyltransferase [Brucellaceae bacterium]
MSAPRIETERLALRGFKRDDLAAMTVFYADEDNTRFIGGVMPDHRVYALVSAFVGHWELNGLGWWAVEEKASGTLVGYCGYNNPPDWPDREIGWSIFPEYQGRGYAPEAAIAARAEIFRIGGPMKLVSYIDPQNAASRRVAEKLGAVHESTIELRGGPAQSWRHPQAEGHGA